MANIKELLEYMFYQHLSRRKVIFVCLLLVCLVKYFLALSESTFDLFELKFDQIGRLF
jgi:hypothetical protein